MENLKKINFGHTNESYKKENYFFQKKIRNGFNHLSNYEILKQFDFVPKLIENNDEFSKWEWINGKHLTNPSNEDLKKLALILQKLHNSDVKFTKSNIRQRIEKYRKIMKEKGIKIDIVEKLYKKINLIVRNMDRSTPIHGDLYQINVLKDENEKIFLIDWEYSHMGDIHFELAYIIEAFALEKEKEKIFLDSYKKFDEYILKKHKILVNYLTILWLYAQDELFFSPEYCIKKLEILCKNEI